MAGPFTSFDTACPMQMGTPMQMDTPVAFTLGATTNSPSPTKKSPKSKAKPASYVARAKAVLPSRIPTTMQTAGNRGAQQSGQPDPSTSQPSAWQSQTTAFPVSGAFAVLDGNRQPLRQHAGLDGKPTSQRAATSSKAAVGSTQQASTARQAPAVAGLGSAQAAAAPTQTASATAGAPAYAWASFLGGIATNTYASPGAAFAKSAGQHPAAPAPAPAAGTSRLQPTAPYVAQAAGASNPVFGQPVFQLGKAEKSPARAGMRKSNLGRKTPHKPPAFDFHTGKLKPPTESGPHATAPAFAGFATAAPIHQAPTVAAFAPQATAHVAAAAAMQPQQPAFFAAGAAPAALNPEPATQGPVPMCTPTPFTKGSDSSSTASAFTAKRLFETPSSAGDVPSTSQRSSETPTAFPGFQVPDAGEVAFSIGGPGMHWHLLAGLLFRTPA